MGDHLGSTSLTLNQNGTVYSEMRYKPFGETAWSSLTETPTQRRYTGQIQDFDDTNMQLYFYNARYYDPELARFTQADTIVPEPGNPQTFNRFSYVKNKPIKYTDPTGHSSQDNSSCTTDWCWQDRWYRAHGFYYNSDTGLWDIFEAPTFDDKGIVVEVLAEAGITVGNLASWELGELAGVAQGVIDFANAVGGMGDLANLLNPLGAGPLTFLRLEKGLLGTICEQALACATGGTKRRIEFYDILFAQGVAGVKYVTVHELAHHIDYNSANKIRTRFESVSIRSNAQLSYRGDVIDQSAPEYWADAVAVWVYPNSGWGQRGGSFTDRQLDFIRLTLKVN